VWRFENTVFAVIAFIAAFMALIVYWHSAGDVSQTKIEADCQKAGGMWDSKMDMCMEKKQSKTHRLTQKRGRSTGG
jgi:hypothetical protein